jgi:uncharacterized membrane protein
MALRSLLSTSAGRVVMLLLLCLVLAVVAGGIAMWPRGGERAPQINVGAIRSAAVVGVSSDGCREFAGDGCRRVDVVLRDGPASGTRSFVALPKGDFSPRLSIGDRIRVSEPPALDASANPDAGGGRPLAFVDFDRGRSLLWLAVVFAGVVLALARWQGVRSLVGLAVSLAVVLLWLVPAILDGRPPLVVALIGGIGVMIVTTAVTHGAGIKSAAAILGAAATLLLIVVLAVVAVDLAQITGLSSDEASLIVAQSADGVSIQALVLAGIVVGALGVLDDVTISQASTVLALRRADPSMSIGGLFREGMTVGRDHLGATVNTLVLAYAGASLPVLLIFADQGMGFADAVTREVVAKEVVATLVGSIGLVAAVPLTTALAALLGTRMPASALLPASDRVTVR